MKKAHYILIIMLMLGVFWFVEGLPYISSAYAQSNATPQPNPTPKPRRKPAWGMQEPIASSAGLMSVVRQFGGQGGGSEEQNSERNVLCPGLMTKDADKAYILTPNRNILYIDHPYYDFDLVVTPCQDNDSATIILIDPNGNIVQPIEPYTFDLQHDAPLGEYELIINTGDGKLSKRLQGSRSVSLRFLQAGKLSIRDATSVLELTDTAQAGHVLQVDYSDWWENRELEVGLFSNVYSGDGYGLLDSWRIMTSNDGTFSEEIIISANARGGDYYLVACDIEYCNSSLSSINTFTYDQLLIEPVIAWRGFTIVAPEEQNIPLDNRHADPVFTRPTKTEISSTPRLFEFRDSTTPTAQYYNVNVQSDETRRWTFAWCAKSKPLLPQIMAPLHGVRFIYDNSKEVSAQNIYEYDDYILGSKWYCHFWSTLISAWPDRPLTFELDYEVTKRFYDGAAYYDPGTYRHVIQVNVID